MLGTPAVAVSVFCLAPDLGHLPTDSAVVAAGQRLPGVQYSVVNSPPVSAVYRRLLLREFR